MRDGRDAGGVKDAGWRLGITGREEGEGIKSIEPRIKILPLHRASWCLCACVCVGGAGKLGLAAEFSDTCFVSSVRRGSRFSTSDHWKKITNGKFMHRQRGVLVL